MLRTNFPLTEKYQTVILFLNCMVRNSVMNTKSFYTTCLTVALLIFVLGLPACESKKVSTESALNYEATLTLRPNRAVEVTNQMLVKAQRNLSTRLSAGDIPNSIIIKPPDQLVVRLKLPAALSREEDVREAFSNHRLTLNVIYEESDKVLAGEVPLPVGFEILRGAGFDDSFVVAKSPLLEDAIDNAYAKSDGPSVHIQLTDEGVNNLKDAVRKKGKLRLAVVLDGRIYSVPTVNEVPSNGLLQISGNFTMNEAEDLAIVLRAGGVPWPLVFEKGHFIK